MIKLSGKAAVLGAAAFLYALLFALGSQIEMSGVTDLSRTLLSLLAALPVALAAVYALFEYVLPRLEMSRDKQAKPFSLLGAWAIIFCCYVPMFLVVYPGSFTYDSMKQVHQVASGEYSTILPLLHTLMIGFCLSFHKVFQSMERCGALYSVLQMLIISGCFAATCQSLSRSLSRRAARIALLCFALHPVHMLFASNCTKDGLFGAFVVLFLALGLEMSAGKTGIVRKALFVFAGVMACLMRGNMMFALGAWMLLSLIFFRRQLRFAGYGLLILAISFGSSALLSRATNASGGSFRELLSLPVQQLVRARVMKPEAFSEEQKALMDDMFEDWIEDMDAFYQTYIPSLSDPVKNAVDNDSVRSRLGEYARLWFDMSRVCAGEYLDAFLNMMHATLYPYRVYPVVFPYADVGGVTALTAPYGLPAITPPARFDAIREWLTKDVFWTGMNEVPVVRYLFHLGWMTWILLLFFFYDMYRGRRERTVMLLAVVLVWATYLMGPVMYARYMYPTICCLPLFVLRPKMNEQ